MCKNLTEAQVMEMLIQNIYQLKCEKKHLEA